VSGEDRIDALEDAFQRAPRCALHPERVARRTPCARCGGYACEACFVSPDETLCESCRARVGAGIAWERDPSRGVLERLWATLTETLPSPYTTFEGLRDGSFTSALLFAAIVNVVSYGAPMLLCAPCMLGAFAFLPGDDEVPRSWMLGIAVGMVVLAPPLAAATQIAASLALGLVYHVSALVAGGRGSLRASLRAMLFTHVLSPISAVAWLLGRIPILGFVISLASYVGNSIWQTFALAGHARGAHGIDDWRAWLVAATPILVGVGVVVALVALVVVIALADGFGLLEDID
jgi:hypothetical protein